MSLAAEKIAEVLALPEGDRAFLAQQLIASLEHRIDADTESAWLKVIDCRSREMEAGHLDDRSETEMIAAIQAKLNACRKAS